MGYSGDLAGGSGSLVKCLIVEGLATFVYSYVFLAQFAGSWASGFRVDFGDSAFKMVSVITVLSWCGFALSGAHLNPAVTLGLMVKSKIEVMKGVWYLVVQAGATFLASMVLYVNTPLSDYKDARTNWWDRAMPQARAVRNGDRYLVLPYEFIATFVFVLVFFAANVGKGGNTVIAGLIIGLGFVFCNSMISAQTFGVLNPYLYLMPRLIIMKLQDVVFYILGPLLGGVLAAFCYEPLVGDNITEDETPMVDLN